jgi:hypothetical protein
MTKVTASDAAVRYVWNVEGFRTDVYRCEAGVLTTGCGFTDKQSLSEARQGKMTKPRVWQKLQTQMTNAKQFVSDACDFELRQNAAQRLSPGVQSTQSFSNSLLESMALLVRNTGEVGFVGQNNYAELKGRKAPKKIRQKLEDYRTRIFNILTSGRAEDMRHLDDALFARTQTTKGKESFGLAKTRTTQAAFAISDVVKERGTPQEKAFLESVITNLTRADVTMTKKVKNKKGKWVNVQTWRPVDLKIPGLAKMTVPEIQAKISQLYDSYAPYMVDRHYDPSANKDPLKIVAVPESTSVKKPVFRMVAPMEHSAAPEPKLIGRVLGRVGDWLSGNKG